MSTFIVIRVFGLIGVCLGYNLMYKKGEKSYKIFLAIYGVFFTYLMNSNNYWTLFAHNIAFSLGILLYLILYFLIFKCNEKFEIHSIS